MTTQTPTFEGRTLPHPDEPVFDQGLAFDVETLLSRRDVLRAVGYGAVALSVGACLPGATPSSSSGATAGPSTAPGAACDTEIPEETAGPFPGDGSNGPDLLTQSGVFRQDITRSFGSSTTVAAGIPLMIRFAILDLSKGCEPMAGAAIYAWHCDQQGRYSMYSAGVENENYLRGIQVAPEDGFVTFRSIFPAAYQGRWPHVHFEVYPDRASAKDVGNKIATSQIALPKDICDEVYATAGYEQSVQNMRSLSLASDMVFGEDEGERQIGTMTGSVASGLTVDLSVPVRA